MKIMMSKVVHIRYTFAMAIIDDIYANVDDFGLVTSAEAKEFGMRHTELVQQGDAAKARASPRVSVGYPSAPARKAIPTSLR